nr:MAG TPA: hypothetical protein [Caudoviricetes sp.]
MDGCTGVSTYGKMFSYSYSLLYFQNFINEILEEYR